MPDVLSVNTKLSVVNTLTGVPFGTRPYFNVTDVESAFKSRLVISTFALVVI